MAQAQFFERVSNIMNLQINGGARNQPGGSKELPHGKLFFDNVCYSIFVYFRKEDSCVRFFCVMSSQPQVDELVQLNDEINYSYQLNNEKSEIEVETNPSVAQLRPVDRFKKMVLIISSKALTVFYLFKEDEQILAQMLSQLSSQEKDDNLGAESELLGSYKADDNDNVTLSGRCHISEGKLIFG